MSDLLEIHISCKRYLRTFVTLKILIYLRTNESDDQTSFQLLLRFTKVPHTLLRGYEGTKVRRYEGNFFTVKLFSVTELVLSPRLPGKSTHSSLTLPLELKRSHAHFDKRGRVEKHRG